MATKKAKRWKRILVAIVSLFVVLVGLAAMMLYKSNEGIQADIAAIHKLGVPTTYPELAACGPQTGEDAGPIYKTFIAGFWHLDKK